MKKILFIVTSILILFMTFSISSVYYFKAEDTSTVNPQLDSNFSKYVNVMNNAVYNGNIKISPLYLNQNYNIGTNFKEQYPNTVTAPNYMKAVSTFKEFGFKCNGSFYTETLELKNNGKYIIEIYNYKEDENDILVPYGNVIETINIEINISDLITLSKDTYFYEHYNTADDLLVDIAKVLPSNSTINSDSVNKITNAFKNYYDKFLINNNDYYDESLDKSLSLEVEYLGETLTLDLFLYSTKRPDLKDSLLDSPTKLINALEPVVINYNLCGDKAGLSIYQNLFNLIDIETTLKDISPSQVFDITYDETLKIPVLSGNEQSKTIIYQYKVSDITTNLKDVKVNRMIYFYNPNYVSNKKIVLEQNMSYTFENNVINLDKFVKDVYLESTLNNGEVIKDRSSIDSLSLTDVKFSEQKVTFNIDVNYYITNMNLQKERKSYNIEIKDNMAPLILAKYNKIYLDSENYKTEYISYFRVIDNISKSSDISVTYSLEEKDNKTGTIYITATDEAGLTSVREFNYVLKPRQNGFQKTIGKLMYEYGKFLKGLFK